MRISDISVVICTRNRSDALMECLLSLDRSTMFPLEVVIIDQSENTDTEEVVSQCSRQTALSLRYIHMDAVGHTKARNLGIVSSRGAIVAFTDDDCTVSPTWIETLAREFGDPDVNCVCGQTAPSNNGHHQKESLLSTIKYRKPRLVTGRHNPITLGRGNNFAFRKHDLYKLGGFNENIGVGSNLYAGDDTDLLYRLLECKGVVSCVNDAVVYHYQPKDLSSVLRKKRGYSISSAAVFASRARFGDVYAFALLAGKIHYEFFYLLLGGMLRLNKPLVLIGWHSLAGSISGLKYFRDRKFNNRMRLLTRLARAEFGLETKRIPMGFGDIELHEPRPAGTEDARN